MSGHGACVVSYNNRCAKLKTPMRYVYFEKPPHVGRGGRGWGETVKMLDTFPAWWYNLHEQEERHPFLSQ